MHRKLVGDGGVLEVGHPVGGEQGREEMSVLLGFGGGQPGQDAGGQAEVEPDAEDMGLFELDRDVVTG